LEAPAGHPHSRRPARRIKTDFARKTNDSVMVAIAGMDDPGRSLCGNGLQRTSDMVSMVDRCSLTWASNLTGDEVAGQRRDAKPGQRGVTQT
jgi:hypothetical protein